MNRTRPSRGSSKRTRAGVIERSKGKLVAATVLAATSLFVTPASINAAPRCIPFTAGIINAAAAPVAQMTAQATKDSPLTIFYEHAPSTPAAPQKLYFNVQIYLPANTTLRGMLTFHKQSDINMFVYDEEGEQVAAADGVNYLPLEKPVDFQNGGRATVGEEGLPAVKAKPCEGFTLESQAFITTGTNVKLELWTVGGRR